ATMPPEIKVLTKKFLSNPREVSVAPPASTADTVEQFMVWTDHRKKYDVLGDIIRKEKVQNAFIFCNRKKDIAGLASWLNKKGFDAHPLHGDMVQSARTRTLEEFKEGKITLLVCSDVAARGLDIKGLSHVFNFDVPMNPDDYVHRIGRTGRAGMAGRAWMLATKDETKYVDAIEKRIKKPVPVATLAGEKEREREPKLKFQEDRKPPRHEQKFEKKIDAPQRSERKPDREDDGEGVVGFGSEMPSFFGKK
ncbi:MAG TPA: DNA helicase, partial [Rhodospirillaceae bacterium]|nr:DNA helicase [Rhodospirillaceae bacterium]